MKMKRDGIAEKHLVKLGPEDSSREPSGDDVDVDSDDLGGQSDSDMSEGEKEMRQVSGVYNVYYRNN